MRVRCPNCDHSFDHTEGRRSKLRARVEVDRPSKLAARPKKPKLRSGGTPQDEKFLRYVRTHACLGCDTQVGVESHHWGKKGASQLCSDYETVPLCHTCHVETLHRNLPLRGLTAREWRPRFRKWSSAAVARYAWQGNVVLN